MNFWDSLSKGPQQYFTFSHLFFKLKFHPLSLGHQPYRCLFWPRSFRDEACVKWSNSRTRVKSNQIVNRISRTSSDSYSFCLSPPLSTLPPHLCQANGQYPEEHREGQETLLCIVDPIPQAGTNRQESREQLKALCWSGCGRIWTNPTR